MNKKYAELDFPAWFDGKDVNEAAFCREFLSKNKLIYADNAFFTPDGRLTDPLLLKEKIYAELECCAAKNIPRTISNIVEIMKLAAHAGTFPPKPKIQLKKIWLMATRTITRKVLISQA